MSHDPWATNLHMLDFRELELLGDEGGVWYDQL